MTTRAEPELEPGRVYRTQDFAAWGANASRLVKRLAAEGTVLPLQHGLYAYPRHGRFGVVPPSDQEIVRAFVRGTPFVFTGPDRWNGLGLGSTAVFPAALVYNTKRSGLFELGGRPFRLRRVAFPPKPPTEWFVVDLFEHAGEAGVARSDLTEALAKALDRGAFDRDRLRKMAAEYGTKATRSSIEAALKAAS